MELHNRFDVPVPPATAFEVLRDIERIGPCMPGATIDEVDGDHFTGRVKVKIGPIQVTYRGEAEYEEVDEDGLTATINARGRESRGAGTANAVVRAVVTDGPDGGATVDVTTDLAITGKPAQFGRGVMADVAEKLIGSFADCLAVTLAEDASDEGQSEATETTEATDDSGEGGDTQGAGDHTTQMAGTPNADTGGRPAAGGTGGTGSSGTSAPSKTQKQAPARAEAIDLLDVAGAPIAQRLAPIAIGLVLLLILRRLLRRS